MKYWSESINLDFQKKILIIQAGSKKQTQETFSKQLTNFQLIVSAEIHQTAEDPVAFILYPISHSCPSTVTTHVINIAFKLLSGKRELSMAVQ